MEKKDKEMFEEILKTIRLNTNKSITVDQTIEILKVIELKKLNKNLNDLNNKNSKH